MGRICLRFINAPVIYVCKRCSAHLTKERDIMSARFRGRTGRAFLFKRAYNTKTGAMKQQTFLTGDHLTRDLFCVNCDTQIGFQYEYAKENDQAYKEGRVLIEKCRLRRIYPTDVAYEPDSDSDSDDETRNSNRV
ncbi:hypothetical protein ACOME3_002106 [Neoechinorhynchus agilis]